MAPSEKGTLRILGVDLTNLNHRDATGADCLVVVVHPGTDTTDIVRHVSSTSHTMLLDDWNDVPVLNSTCFDIPSYLKPSGINFAHLFHTYGKLLTEAEKALIREINFKPTRDGIKLCQAIHSEAVNWIKSLSPLKVRFDRRVPRWRAGRWKSVT